ncbi:glucose-6-phosphate isomerase [Thermoproteota archaeon]
MTKGQYKNLTQTKAYSILASLADHFSAAKTPASGLAANQILDLKQLLTPERIQNYTIDNGLLKYSYSASLVTDEIITALQALADEQQVIPRYQELLSGERVNLTECRSVQHHKTRSRSDRGFYGEQQARVSEFASKVRQGLIKGSMGKPFNHVVQIGIGGSDLGPRAMYLALQGWALSEREERMGPDYNILHNRLDGAKDSTYTAGRVITADFISNVDPDDANLVLSKIDFETTLFIAVSKSGTTQETLTNLAFVKQKALESGIMPEGLSCHFIAVTGKGSPMDNPDLYTASFYIDDAIGGRYSSTSVVGGVLLSIAYGAEVFDAFLNGASSMDNSSLNPDITQNMSLLSAMIGVWERNFLNFPAKAVIPYSQALIRFSAHLQQLDCESNGKHVNQYGGPLDYKTSPVIFGEPGTNSQHSFFQMLHQGTDIIPIQFIGFAEPQIVDSEGLAAESVLNANLIAQIAALALGKDNTDPRKQFDGGRPSSLIYGASLTPSSLGALLAFYENAVMFQGFIWNVNSFDQEGVQLGKSLANQLLSEPLSEKDPVLAGFAAMLS